MFRCGGTGGRYSNFVPSFVALVMTIPCGGSGGALSGRALSGLQFNRNKVPIQR